MRKLFLMILSVLLIFGLMVPVNAEDEKEVILSSLVSDVAVKVSDVPDSILSVLAENGAKIKDDSLIKVLPVENSEDTAICVTNFDGITIEQNVFMAYKEDSSGKMVVDNSMAKALAQGSDHNMPGSYPPISWDGSYIVNATATAAKYIDYDNDPYGWMPFYKPYKCSFNYTNYDNVNVNSIEVRYITEGVKYSYPGFSYMGDTYGHTVTASKTNPSEGTTYTGYNYFPEDFVLACDDIEDMVLTFFNKIDGTMYSGTVKLLNDY